MSRISLSSLRRVSREDLQGAPDWVDPLLTASNEFQEQATAALERPLLTGVLDTYDFVHGVEQIIKSPLGVMPSGVSDVRCRGVTVDSAGKPTGAFYTLGVSRIDWRPVQSRPGEPIRVGVTAYFAPTSTSGYVGESSRSAIASASAVSLTTTTAADVTSISLGAGEWDISGLIINGGSPTGFTEFGGAVNTTSANIGTSGDNQGLCVLAGGIPTITSISVPPRRYTLTTTTSVYLVARAVFTGGTCTAYGRIEAVRAQDYSTGLRGKITLRFDGGN